MPTGKPSITTYCKYCHEFRAYVFDHQIKMEDGRDTTYDLYVCGVCGQGRSARPRDNAVLLMANGNPK